MRGNGLSALAAAVGGALVTHLLPFSPAGIPHARAAWCWPADPPKCDAPVVTDGSCAEGAVLAAGQVCTPECGAGKVPSCTRGVVQCPPSGGPGCQDDIREGGWWVPCGLGDRCLSRIQLGGSGRDTDAATFECLSPDAAISPCGDASEVRDVDAGSTSKSMDVATLVFLGCLLVLLPLGAALVRLPAPESTRLLFKPGPMQFSLANMLGVVLVLIGLIAFVAGLAGGKSNLEITFVTGLASGLVSSLPIWWACYRAGVHSAFKMSREAAWRIHIVFGDLTLIFGVVHGSYAYSSALDITSNIFWTFGLLGVTLMILGVLPAAIHHMAPGIVKYDVWKLLHFISMLGYLLVIIHMVDHALKFETARSWAVTLANILALVVFIGQKLYVKLTAQRASVASTELLTEPCGQHLLLRLSVPGFRSPAPGQWGYLSVPSVSMVPHPFTLVPGTEQGEVQFFIKVSGKFTAGLAQACSKGPAAAPAMSLEGPFGEPPLPSLRVDAVAFVLGGVGVTPALSLLAEARKMCGDKVCLYWALRSPGLLRRCAPLLEPSVNRRLTCVRLSGGGEEVEGALPLDARLGHEDVAEWLASVSADLQSQGARTALLFCCGPAPLSAAALAGTGRRTDGVVWHVHVEQFLFLPHGPSGSKRKGGRGVAPVQVIGASST